jgi:hypothetical protein
VAGFSAPSKAAGSGDADVSNDTDQLEDEDNHDASKGNGKEHKSLPREPSILVFLRLV